MQHIQQSIIINQIIIQIITTLGKLDKWKVSEPNYNNSKKIEQMKNVSTKLQQLLENWTNEQMSEQWYMHVTNK
jgi:hypothetical protein